MIGTRLHQYLIEAELGAGGMGVVYRALDTRLERPVAIKVIPGGDDKARERLLREARSASALNHPHVCTIYEVGEFEETTYLVMELVDGRTLQHTIPARGLAPGVAITYGVQVARALAHAHARGVIHRDLKSANVVIADGHAKVLDFGLAVRQADRWASDLTKTADTLQAAGNVSGTLAYMAPESLLGGVSDASADIWALGVLLYEMVAGQLPFQGQTAFEVANRIMNEPPRSLGENVPKGLAAVIHRCLAKSAARRYANAGEVAAALETLQSEGEDPSRTRTFASSAATQSVLVVPFVNVSDDSEGDYFSDGLTDELIADLSTIKHLRVISRTSSMGLKGTARALADLAAQFHVGLVLEGTVRRLGNRIRITATLVDPSSDSPIWGDKYTGTLDDVFEIQATISRSIAEALRITLSVEEEQRLLERPIADIRAYEWYLRARQELLRFTDESLSRALECLDRATAIAGENVLLLAATGTAYWQYVNAGIRPDPSYLDKADACAQRILEIAPASPHGHRVAGLVRIHRGDIPGCLRELRQAISVDPNDTDSLLWGSLVAGMSGKSELAHAWASRLVEIDPVTPFHQLLPGSAAWMAGDFESARQQYAQHQAAVMETPILQLVNGQILLASGHEPEGRAALDALARALPDNPFGQLAAVYLAAIGEDREGVRAGLSDQLIAAIGSDPQYSWFIAQCYALAGYVDEGIQWVTAAVERGFLNYPMLVSLDPLLASLRGDARYTTLMADLEQRWRALDV